MQKKAYKSTMSKEEKSNAAQLIHKQANMLPTVKSKPKPTRKSYKYGDPDSENLVFSRAESADTQRYTPRLCALPPHCLCFFCALNGSDRCPCHCRVPIGAKTLSHTHHQPKSQALTHMPRSSMPMLTFYHKKRKL